MTFAIRTKNFLSLARQELRLSYFEMCSLASVRGKRGLPHVSLALCAVMYLVIHLLAWAAMDEAEPITSPIPLSLLKSLMAGVGIVFVIMFAFAFHRVIATLFERGDRDLWLSSPVSVATFIRVRILTVTASTASVFIYTLTPIANIGFLLNQPCWLGIYPTLLGLAAIASATASASAMVLAHNLGIRRMKITVHLLGFTVAALLAILFLLDLPITLYSFHLTDSFGSSSIVWLPALAVLGDPMSLAFLTVVSFIGYWGATSIAAGYMRRGVRNDECVVNDFIPVGHSSFNRSIVQSIFRKEWRLISRNPQIYQVLTLLAAALILLFFMLSNSPKMITFATGIVYTAVVLSSALITIVISSEQASDLLRLSPISASKIRNAKLLAALAPVSLLVLPLLFVIFMITPSIGLVTFAVCAAAMTSTCLVKIWSVAAQPRSKFNARQQISTGAAILELMNNIGWAGTIYGGLRYGRWFLIPLTIALLALIIAWVAAPEEQLS